MTTGTVIATETATGTGIVIEIVEGATRETTEEMTEETIDVMTAGMIGVTIGAEMIVDVHVHVPATDEIANLRPLEIPLEIPPKSQRRLLQSKMTSSRRRGQSWKHGRKREKPRKP